ncbi:Protein tyrosine/serine phosphatase [Kingella potus]|uniref:Protein tyrosine/serine phosphatase n=1 Tax=Kingella potus TaxID=265175 RepID=A0A377R305_9NEIS|nr:tyrosine-protein phosphatase [Kingella potus]UOO99909.1 tyrosine-protein phosphatase [Kingella potus]STR03167.1 Protein tyrosine/serine phosphatase [Kingella potus]
MSRKRALILAALLPLAAHAQNGAAASEPVYRWASPVKEDANLYQIDDKLYRSEQLTRADAPHIKHLGIKSVVNLRYFDRDDNHTELAGSGAELFNRPLLTWRITPKHIAQTLHLIEQRRQHGPVLIHCYHGADRTGLIAAMYRIVYQDWPIEEAKREMQQGPYGHHSIWRNLGKLFTEDKVRQVKEELAKLKAQQQ